MVCKKFIFLFLSYVSFSINILAQPTIQWEKAYGGSDNELFYSACLTFDGGIAFVGYSESVNGDVTGNHGFDDVWVVKTDMIGNILWSKCFGGQDDEEGYSIKQTIDSGFVIAASARNNSGDVSGVHGHNVDDWVVKLNSTGDIQWQKCFGGTEREVPTAIIQTSDSGYLVVGDAYSIDFDVAGNHINGDVWALKLTQDSVKQWAKCLGGSQSDGGSLGECCFQTASGDFFIAAVVSSTDGDVSGNHGGSEMWVVKLDASGQIIWQKCYGGSGLDGVYSIRPSSNGGFYLAGTTDSNDGDVSSSIGSGDFWLLKVDSSGTIIWEKCFGGSSIELANAMCLTSDGGIALAGFSYSNDGQVSGAHGTNDYWVIKVDSNGTLEWGKSLGGSQMEQAFVILQTPDDGLVVAGASASNDGDVTNNHGNNDAWVVKLAPVGLQIPETKDNLMDLKAFQHDDYLNFQFFSKQIQKAEAALFNTEGKKIISEKISINEGINHHQFNCANFSKGIYFLKIDGKDFSQSAKVTLQ